MMLEGVTQATPVFMSGAGQNDMWNNPFMMLVWLSALGNGGIFGAANRDAFSNEFLYTNLSAGQREIGNGIAAATFQIGNQIDGVGKAVLEGSWRNDLAIAQQTSTIIANADANTRAILDKMCEGEIFNLRAQLCAAGDALTESRITAQIAALPKSPIAAYIVDNCHHHHHNNT